MTENSIKTKRTGSLLAVQAQVPVSHFYPGGTSSLPLLGTSAAPQCSVSHFGPKCSSSRVFQAATEPSVAILGSWVTATLLNTGHGSVWHRTCTWHLKWTMRVSGDAELVREKHTFSPAHGSFFSYIYSPWLQRPDSHAPHVWFLLP